MRINSPSQKKTGPTCSVCRTALSVDTPLIPNFVVDNTVAKHVGALRGNGTEGWAEGGAQRVEWEARKELRGAPCFACVYMLTWASHRKWKALAPTLAARPAKKAKATVALETFEVVYQLLGDDPGDEDYEAPSDEVAPQPRRRRQRWTRFAAEGAAEEGLPSSSGSASTEESSTETSSDEEAAQPPPPAARRRQRTRTRTNTTSGSGLGTRQNTRRPQGGGQSGQRRQRGGSSHGHRVAATAAAAAAAASGSASGSGAGSRGRGGGNGGGRGRRQGGR
jgi:hypothetical protein